MLIVEPGARVVAVPSNYASPSGATDGFVEPPAPPEARRGGPNLSGPRDGGGCALECDVSTYRIIDDDILVCGGVIEGEPGRNGTPHSGEDGGPGQSLDIDVHQYIDPYASTRIRGGRGGNGADGPTGSGKGGRGGCVDLFAGEIQTASWLSVHGGAGGTGGSTAPIDAGNGGNGGDGGEVHVWVPGLIQGVPGGYPGDGYYGGQGGAGGDGRTGGNGGDGGCVVVTAGDVDFMTVPTSQQCWVEAGSGGVGGQGVELGGHGGDGGTFGLTLGGFRATEGLLHDRHVARLKNGSGGDGGAANNPNTDARGGDGGNVGFDNAYRTDFPCNPPECRIENPLDLHLAIDICWGVGGRGGNATAATTSGAVSAVGGNGGDGSAQLINLSILLEHFVCMCNNQQGCGISPNGGCGGDGGDASASGGDASATGGDGGAGSCGGDGGDGEAYGGPGGDATGEGGDGGSPNGDGGDGTGIGGDAPETPPGGPALPGGDGTGIGGQPGGPDGLGGDAIGQGGQGGAGANGEIFDDCESPGSRGAPGGDGISRPGPGGGGDAIGGAGGAGGGIGQCEDPCRSTGLCGGEGGEAIVLGPGSAIPGQDGTPGSSTVPSTCDHWCLCRVLVLQFHDCDGSNPPGLEDFEQIGPCLLGPSVPYSGQCSLYDYDGNFRVDLRDLADFQTAYFLP